jgi:hypothetical protein
MAPNNNNTDIKKTMSPRKKDWLSEMRPIALEVIDEQDELLEQHKMFPNTPHNKNMIKYHSAIKAFYICVCNADIAGCRWWFGKFKDRGLKNLEIIQESKVDCVSVKIDDGEVVEEIKGQDYVYMLSSTKMKNTYSAMENVLSCLIEF